MKTKAECLQHAVLCERMAADADRANRETLLATAAHWRTLADHAPVEDADCNGLTARDAANRLKAGGGERDSHTREPTLKGGPR